MRGFCAKRITTYPLSLSTLQDGVRSRWKLLTNIPIGLCGLLSTYFVTACLHLPILSATNGPTCNHELGIHRWILLRMPTLTGATVPTSHKETSPDGLHQKVFCPVKTARTKRINPRASDSRISIDSGRPDAYKTCHWSGM